VTGDFDVVRHPTARTIRLSVCPASGRVRLTVPRRAGMKAAIAWAEGKRDWIAAQRAALPAAVPFVEGAVLPVADRAITVTREAGSRRALRLDGDRLMVAGPEETVARRVEAWLRGRALGVLEADTAHYAARAGVTVERVAVGDPRGRWGSCSSSGAIRYSWRLVLAPGFVREATAAHEVAHRVHMNHGPDFHALVAELLGRDPAPAREWLRAHGAGLHGFGRGSGSGSRPGGAIG
jgi:predicted metal-dependent hydrolase